MLKLWALLVVICIINQCNAFGTETIEKVKRAKDATKEALKSVKSDLLTPKDSLACYKTHTENLVKTLAVTANKLNTDCKVAEVQKPFKTITVRKIREGKLSITKTNNRKNFDEGRDALKEGVKTITPALQRCFGELGICVEAEKKVLVESIQKFKTKMIGCGDPEFLKENLITLEQLCKT